MTVLPSSTKLPRLAIIATHPIQYYAPLYKELASRGIVDVVVFYLSDAGAVAHKDNGFQQAVCWDIPMLDGYRHFVFQPGTAIADRRFWSLHDSRLTRELARVSPDWILLYGYASRMNWIASAWAKRNGVKIAYTSDSNIRDPTTRLRSLAKRLFVTGFMRMMDVFLATSEANQAYLEKFGARRQRIIKMPFAIDVGRFASNRPQPGAGRRFDFIWAGKLMDLKRPSDFLEAMDKVARQLRRPVRGCVIGDGALREVLERKAKELSHLCTVEFRGFVNQRSMPAHLQEANVFVFTSEREAYGLAATEAAAAGLALIVADRIGCVGKSSLARPGVNAFTFQASDVDGLAAAMAALMSDPGLLKRMQAASESIVREHDLGIAAAAIEGAIR